MGDDPPARQELTRLLRALFSRRQGFAQYTKTMDRGPTPFLGRGRSGQYRFVMLKAGADAAPRRGHLAVGRPADAPEALLP